MYLVPEGYKHGEKTVNAINEYLDGEGAPYYIEFQGLPDSDTSAYETVVKAHVKSADLLFTGRSGTGYVELTGEDALLCLDEYLASEEGRRLYESLPADNWYAVTIGDSICLLYTSCPISAAGDRADVSFRHEKPVGSLNGAETDSKAGAEIAFGWQCLILRDVSILDFRCD